MDRLTSYLEPGPRYRLLRITGVFFILTGAVMLAIGVLLLVFGVSLLVGGGAAGPPPGAGGLAVRPATAGPLGFTLGDDFAARPSGPGRLGSTQGGALYVFCSFCLLFGGLQSVAMGAVCGLLIDVEENTRASAQSLDRIRLGLESREEGSEPHFVS